MANICVFFLIQTIIFSPVLRLLTAHPIFVTLQSKEPVIQWIYLILYLFYIHYFEQRSGLWFFFLFELSIVGHR